MGHSHISCSFEITLVLLAVSDFCGYRNNRILMDSLTQDPRNLDPGNSNLGNLDPGSLDPE